MPTQEESTLFTITGGVMTGMGTLGGVNSHVFGITDSGIIVGQADTASASHAFSFSGGIMTDLGTLGGTNSVARAINSAGTIVGQSDTSGGNSDAFSYSGGTMTDLGTLGGTQSILRRSILREQLSVQRTPGAALWMRSFIRRAS